VFTANKKYVAGAFQSMAELCSLRKPLSHSDGFDATGAPLNRSGKKAFLVAEEFGSNYSTMLSVGAVLSICESTLRSAPSHAGIPRFFTRRCRRTVRPAPIIPQNPIRPARISAEKSGDWFAALAAVLMCARSFNSGNGRPPVTRRPLSYSNSSSVPFKRSL
jgi:hypothetical protein